MYAGAMGGVKRPVAVTDHPPGRSGRATDSRMAFRWQWRKIIVVKPTSQRFVLCVGVTPALQVLWQFDNFCQGDVNRARTHTTTAAGKGVNVARVLRTLGTPTMLLGFAGGESGRQLGAHLDRWKIPHDLVRVAAPTRTCHTLLDRSTATVTELVEESARPSAAEWDRLFRKYQQLLGRARMVVIAGALMPGAATNIYARMVRLATSRNVPVMIDSQKQPLWKTLSHHPAIVRLNVHELENTLEQRLRTDRAILGGARELLAAGAGAVVLSAGARGAWLVEAETALLARAPRVAALNPIGSGDALTAGIACGLGRRKGALVEAVGLGVACGAANAMTLTTGLVRKTDIQRLRNRVRIVSAGR